MISLKTFEAELADRGVNFPLKVQHTKWQKDWTLKSSSEILTMTCVGMLTPFAKMVLLLVKVFNK